MTDTRADELDDTPSTDPSGDALALRRPDVPVTLSELAARKNEGLEILEARVAVLTTARRAGIRMTSPPDWVAYKAPEDLGGQIVCYLQDCGADRVRDILGIEIFNVGKPEKIAGTEPGSFHYIISGSGRCKLTRQVVEQMEGGRSSTDEFVKDKTGAELELLVRKAARANLDGNVTRELAGLKSVPIEELRDAWVGTNKRIAQVRLGRGFGTRDERVGGRAEKAPDVDPPVCPHCGATGVYRPAKGDRQAFYGCRNYAKHPDRKFIVDAATWMADRPRAAATTGSTRPVADREPGQDG